MIYCDRKTVYCADVEQLVAFSRKHKLPMSYFSREPIPHFRVNPHKALKALRAGAKLVSTRDILDIFSIAEVV